MKTNFKLLFVALLVALPVVTQAQFTYTTNADNTITITGYTGSGGDVTIPATVTGLPVTTIGAETFAGAPLTLTSVTIPDSVTSIGGDPPPFPFENDPFAYCQDLTTIDVAPSNPAYSSLNGVLFDKNRTTLIRYPIGNTATTYVIPDTVTSIGVYAFNYCANLTNVVMGNKLASIGNAAFENCGLSNVTIPNGVMNIGDAAFSGTALASVTIPDSVTNIGSYAFTTGYIGGFPSNPILTNVVIGNSVTSIGEGTFAGAAFTGVTIPASVTSIGNGAFAGCSSLTDVTIPASVTGMGNEAFAGCFSLTRIYFKGNAPSTGLGVFAVYSYSSELHRYFYYIDPVTAYYLPEATGWNSHFAPGYEGLNIYLPPDINPPLSFDGIPTALWLPQMQTADGSFGVRNNQFGFNVTWASNQTIVVEACTNLVNPAWQTVQTNTLMSDSVYFRDSQWTNYPARFYRLRSP